MNEKVSQDGVGFSMITTQGILIENPSDEVVVSECCVKTIHRIRDLTELVEIPISENDNLLSQPNAINPEVRDLLESL